MDIARRNNVHVSGSGRVTLFFCHGFGCDQTMWRFIEPAYAGSYRTVLFDLVGSGKSDLAAYDPHKYGSLQGYAEDVLEIAREFGEGPGVFVGHSVGAMIGMLAGIRKTAAFAAQIMVGPSPCFINDGDYKGGFERDEVERLLQGIEANYAAWSSAMAPVIMGAPDRPELSMELTESFCRTDPAIASQFARVTFLCDHRADLAKLRAPALILQSSKDRLAPRTVGEYMYRKLPDATLMMVENVGHCPHVSAPGASTDAIDSFLAVRGF